MRRKTRHGETVSKPVKSSVMGKLQRAAYAARSSGAPQIWSAAAMGCARDSTSKGGRSVTAATVAGQESVIQKYLRPARVWGGVWCGCGRLWREMVRLI